MTILQKLLKKQTTQQDFKRSRKLFNQSTRSLHSRRWWLRRTRIWTEKLSSSCRRRKSLYEWLRMRKKEEKGRKKLRCRGFTSLCRQERGSEGRRNCRPDSFLRRLQRRSWQSCSSWRLRSWSWYRWCRWRMRMNRQDEWRTWRMRSCKEYWRCQSRMFRLIFNSRIGKVILWIQTRLRGRRWLRLVEVGDQQIDK